MALEGGCLKPGGLLYEKVGDTGCLGYKSTKTKRRHFWLSNCPSGCTGEEIIIKETLSFNFYFQASCPLSLVYTSLVYKCARDLSEIRCWRYALRYALRLWSRVSFKLIDRLVMCLRVRRARC